MESAGNNCRIELTDSLSSIDNIHSPLLGKDSTTTPKPTIAASNGPSSMYVLSTENISQLLKTWKRSPHDTKSSSSSNADFNDINKNTHDGNKERHIDYSHLESILPFDPNLEEDFSTRWNTAELEMEIDGVFCWLLVLLEDMNARTLYLTIKCSLSTKSKMQMQKLKLNFKARKCVICKL